VISVVIPWKIFEGRCGFASMEASDCPSMSIKPGATIMPRASIIRLASAPSSAPICTIRPFRTATSPEYQGEPVPSMMWPPRMIKSNCCAFTGLDVASAVRSAMLAAPTQNRRYSEICKKYTASALLTRRRRLLRESAHVVFGHDEGASIDEHRVGRVDVLRPVARELLWRVMTNVV
jgi:hypothetical protein